MSAARRRAVETLRHYLDPATAPEQMRRMDDEAIECLVADIIEATIEEIAKRSCG